MFQELQTLHSELASHIELEAIDTESHCEITQSLYPKDAQLRHHITEVGTHRVQSDICTSPEGRGEEP